MPSTPWKNDHILSCMSSLLYTPEKKMTYLVKSCQRQSNGYDCGVFSIAFVTSLVTGEDPENRLCNQKKLRAHLMDCLVSGTLTPFLSDPIRAKRSREIVQEEELLSPNRMGEKGVGAHRI
jgi:polycystin 1L2